MDPAVTPTIRLVIKFARIFVVLVVAVIIAVALVKTRPQPQKEEKVSEGPLIETIVARQESPHMIVSSYGTIRSGEYLDVTSEVAGSLVETAPNFEEGSFFPKGAFLARIDPRDFKLAVERLGSEVSRLDAEMERLDQERKNLEATLGLAQKDEQLAKADYDRNLKLFKREVAAQAALDKSQQSWLVSQNRVLEIKNSLALIKPRKDLLLAQKATARAQLEQARLDLERTEITAPFDCRILDKLVDNYQYVARGAKLARIYNVNQMEVEALVPQDELVWLGLEPRAQSGDKRDPIQARVIYSSSDHEIVWPGVVVRDKGRIDERTRTLPLVVAIEDAKGKDLPSVTPGMFVTVELIGKQLENVFLLPREAVQENSLVYIVNGERTRVRKVVPIRWVGDQVYVSGDLTDGAKVIIRFPGVIDEGLKVRVKEQAPSGD